jgi:Cellulose biosynthesis protein BcsS
VAVTPLRGLLAGGLMAGGLLGAGAAAHADDRLWILTGEGYSDNYYFGGGLIIPFPRSHLGQGWVQRYWLDTFTYSYDAGEQQIDASVWGAEAMLGYQASRPGLSGAAYAGVRYSNAHLSPDDPGSALHGQQLFPKGQVEGEAMLSQNWRASAIAAYTLVLDGYWTRLRLLRNIGGTRLLGPEVIAQGDPDYSALKLGLVLGGIALSPKVFLNVKGGYRWQSGFDSPYLGAELVGEF